MTDTKQQSLGSLALDSPLVLKVYGSNQSGNVLRLPGSQCWVGSGASCDLRLRFPNIAARQCLIRRGRHGAVAQAQNGACRLNGESFREAAIQQGDVLELGPVQLEVIDLGLGVAKDRPPASSSKLPKAGAEWQWELEGVRQGLDSVRAQFDASVVSDRHGLGQRLEETQRRLETALSRLEQSQLHVETVDADRGRMALQLRELSQERELLSDELSSLKEEFESRTAELDEAATKNESLQARLGELDKQLRTQRADHTQLKQHHADDRRQLEHMRRELEQQRTQLDSWRTERQSLLDQLQQQQNLLVQQSEQHELEMARANRQLSTLTEAEQRAEQQLQELSEQAELLEQLRAQLESANVRREEEARLRETLDVRLQDAVANLDQLREQLEEERNEHAVVCEQRDTAEHSHQELLGKVEGFAEECEQLRDQLEKLRGEHESACQQRDNAESARREELEQADQVRAECDRLRGQFDELRSEHNSVCQQRDAVESARADLQGTVEQVTAESTRLREALEAQRESFNALEAKSRQLEDEQRRRVEELQRLEEQLAEAAQTLEGERAGHEQAQQAAMEMHAQAARDLEQAHAEAEALEAKLKSQVAEHEALEGKYTAAIKLQTELEGSVAAMRKSVEEVQRTADERAVKHAKEIDGAKADYRVLTEKYRGTRAKAKSLDSELRRAREEHRIAAVEWADQHEALEEQTEELGRQLVDQTKAHAEVVEELKAGVAEWQEKAKGFEAKAAETQKQCEQLSQQLADAADERTAMETTLQERNEYVQAVEEQWKQAQETFEQTQAGWTEKESQWTEKESQWAEKESQWAAGETAWQEKQLSWEHQCSKFEEQRSKFEEQRSELESQLEQVEVELGEAKAEAMTRAKEVDALKTELDTRLAAANSKSDALSALSAQAAQWEQQRVDLLKQQAALEEQLQQAAGQAAFVEQVRVEGEQRDQELAELRKQCSDLIIERDGARQAVTELEDRLSGQNQVWLEEQGRVERLEQEYAKAQADLLASESSIQELQAELAGALENAPASDEVSDDESGELEALRQECERLQIELETANQQQVELQVQLEQQASSLAAQLDPVGSADPSVDSARLSETNADLERELAELRSQCEQLAGERDVAVERVMEKDSEVLALRDQLELAPSESAPSESPRESAPLESYDPVEEAGSEITDEASEPELDPVDALLQEQAREEQAQAEQALDGAWGDEPSSNVELPFGSEDAVDQTTPAPGANPVESGTLVCDPRTLREAPNAHSSPDIDDDDLRRVEEEVFQRHETNDSELRGTMVLDENVNWSETPGHQTTPAADPSNMWGDESTGDDWATNEQDVPADGDSTHPPTSVDDDGWVSEAIGDNVAEEDDVRGTMVMGEQRPGSMTEPAHAGPAEATNLTASFSESEIDAAVRGTQVIGEAGEPMADEAFADSTLANDVNYDQTYDQDGDDVATQGEHANQLPDWFTQYDDDGEDDEAESTQSFSEPAPSSVTESNLDEWLEQELAESENMMEEYRSHAAESEGAGAEAMRGTSVDKEKGDEGSDAGDGANLSGTVSISGNQSPAEAFLNEDESYLDELDEDAIGGTQPTDAGSYTSPMSEDDLEFKSADDGPTTESAADVLARLGHNIEMDDDYEDDHDKPASPEPVVNDTMPVNSLDDDDEPIEEYMEQLLRRVRGGLDAEKPSDSAAKSAGVEQETKEPEPELEKLDPETYKPKSEAPEKSSSLQAMRDLANDSARSAISTHAQGDYVVSVVRKRYFAWAAGAVAAASTCMLVLGSRMFAGLLIPSALLCVLWLRQSKDAAERLVNGKNTSGKGE